MADPPPPPYPGNPPDMAYPPGEKGQPFDGGYPSAPGNYPPPAGGYAPPPGAYPPPAGSYPPPPGGYGPPPGGYGPPPPGMAPPPGAPLNAGYAPGQGYPGAPPPGYGQAGQPGPPGQTVVVTAPTTTVIAAPLRDHPTQTVCPRCQAQIVTGTQYESGTFTWLICLVLCCVGCDAGCCLIPFCVDGCKDVVHTCPNCQQVVSRYNRL